MEFSLQDFEQDFPSPNKTEISFSEFEQDFPAFKPKSLSSEFEQDFPIIEKKSILDKFISLPKKGIELIKSRYEKTEKEAEYNRQFIKNMVTAAYESFIEEPIKGTWQDIKNSAIKALKGESEGMEDIPFKTTRYATGRLLKSMGAPIPEKLLQDVKADEDVEVAEVPLKLAGKINQLAAISQMTAGVAPKIMEGINAYAQISPALARAIAYGAQRALTWGTGSLVDEVSQVISKDKELSSEVITEPLLEAGFGATIGSIHAIKSIPTKVILAGANRAAWTALKEKIKKGEITEEGIKNIWFNAALGSIVEAIGSKQLKEQWEKEDLLKLSQFKTTLVSKETLDTMQRLKSSLDMATAQGNITEAANIQSKINELTLKGVKKIPSVFSSDEIKKLQNDIKPSALNLGLQQIPTSAMALKQQDFNNYLTDVVDKIKGGVSFVEAFNLAANELPPIDINSEESIMNINEKLSLSDKYIAPKESISKAKDKIIKDVETIPLNRAKRKLEEIQLETDDKTKKVLDKLFKEEKISLPEKTLIDKAIKTFEQEQKSPIKDIIKDASKTTDATDYELYGDIEPDGFDQKTGQYFQNEKGEITIGMFTDAPINALNNINKSLDNLKLQLFKFPNIDVETKANLNALRVNPEVLLEDAINFYAQGIFKKYATWDNATWDKVINAGELYSKATPGMIDMLVKKGELPEGTKDVLQMNEVLAQWHLENDTSRGLYKEGFPQSFINKADKSIEGYEKAIALKKKALEQLLEESDKNKYLKTIKKAEEEIERLNAYKEFLKNIPYFPRYMNRQDLEAYIEEKGLKTAGTKSLQSLNLKFKKFIGRKIPVQTLAKEMGIPYEPNLIKRWIHRSTYSWQKWLLHDYMQDVIKEGTFIKPDYMVESNPDFVDPPAGFDQIFKDQKDEMGQAFSYKMDKYFKHGLEQVLPSKDIRTMAGKTIDTFQGIAKQLKFYNPIMMGMMDTGQSLRIEGHFIPAHPKEWLKAYNDYMNHTDRFKELRLAGCYKQNFFQIEDQEKLINAAIDAAVGTPYQTLMEKIKQEGFDPLKLGMKILKTNKKIAFGMHEINLTMMANYLIDKRGFSIAQAAEHASRALGGSDLFSKEAAKWMHRIFLTPQFTVDGFLAYGNILRHPVKEWRGLAGGAFAHLLPKLLLGWMGWKAWTMTQEGRFKKTVLLGPYKKEMEKVITLPGGYFWLERITGRKIEKSLWYRLNTLPQTLSRISTFWWAGGGELRDFTGKVRVMSRDKATDAQRYKQLASFIVSDFFAPYENLSREQQEQLKDPIEKMISVVFGLPIYFREPRDDEQHFMMKWINKYLNEPGKYTIEEIAKTEKYNRELKRQELDEAYLRAKTPEEIEQFNREFIDYHNIKSGRQERRLIEQKNLQYKQRLFKQLPAKSKEKYFPFLPEKEQELVKDFLPTGKQLRRSRKATNMP